MTKSQITNHKRDVYLILDPGSHNGRLRFFVFDGKGKAVAQHAFEADRKAIEFMLAEIEKKLRKIERGLHDIKGIMVMRGGESFSAVRGVHAIANALAWSLGVPSVAIKKPESQEIQLKDLKSLKRRKSFNLLLPTYSRPPNITMSK